MSNLPISVFENRTDNEPKDLDLNWPEDFSSPVVTPTKDVLGWSPATYRPGATRSNDGVLTMSALVLDCDSDPNLEALALLWLHFEHVVYSTFSHTPDFTKVRVVLPYTEPVTPAEHRKLWRWAEKRCAEASIKVDPACKDPARFYYWPSLREGLDADDFIYWFNDVPERVNTACLPAVDAGTPVGVRASRAGGGSLAATTLGASFSSGSVEALRRTLAGERQPPRQLEDLDLIEQRCAFMRHARDEAATLPEPEWYGALSVYARCKDGEELAHLRSQAYPNYSEAETAEKLERSKLVGPMTCAKARELGGASGPCRGCPFNITSPVQLGSAVLVPPGSTVGAKPPTIIEADEETAELQEVSDELIERASAWGEEAEERLTQAQAALQEIQTQRGLAKHAIARAKKYATDEEAQLKLAEFIQLDALLVEAKKYLKTCEREVLKAQRAADRANPSTGAHAATLAILALDPRTDAPKASLGNTRLILENDPKYKGLLRMNNFSLVPFYFGKKAQDFNEVDMATDIEYRYGVEVPVGKVRDATLAVAATTSFHPVVDYLQAQAWDGVSRVADLLKLGFSALGEDDQLAEFSTKFMVSCVARIFKPGCDVDTMLVLVGPQGAGKSKGLRLLVSPPEMEQFGPWYANSKLDLLNKDAYLLLQGRWLFEVAELDSFRRAENTTIKAFLSSSIDTFRPPYGRHVIESPRQGVLVGTTNEEEFLSDSTGSRRYVPVRIDPDRAVDMEWLEENRNQLWAEAKVLFETGTSWWFSGEAASRLAKASEDFQTEDAWTEPILEYLSKVPTPRTTITVFDLLTNALGMSHAPNIEARHKQRVGAILGKLKFPKHQIREHGTKKYIYTIPEEVRRKGKVIDLRAAGT